ncbi:MAG: AraC family transcriptional regulator [Bacteroidota bacterium]
MNPPAFDWSLLLAGIQFILGLQLIVVAVLLFFYRSKRTAIPLAVLCLIHGLWFFKRVFAGYWDESLLLFLLIGPGKPIFAGALLLFYYKLYSERLQTDAVTEITLFKRLFLPENVLVNQLALSNKDVMNRLIQQHFGEDKIFKNPQLTLETCAQTMHVSKRELVAYFGLGEKGAFKDFINQWRVDEFKAMVNTEGGRHYDLVGLAKECGFSSKSTFFRVFKKFEGMTPNQYKRQLQQ